MSAERPLGRRRRSKTLLDCKAQLLVVLRPVQANAAPVRTPSSLAKATTPSRTGLVPELGLVRASAWVELQDGGAAREVLARCSRKCSLVPGRRLRRFVQMPVAPASRAGRAGAAPAGQDPGQDRRHADADFDPGVDEVLQRAKPLARMGRARLRLAPDLLVERRDREGDRDLGALRRFVRTSTSRTIIGPRVISWNGFENSATPAGSRVGR